MRFFLFLILFLSFFACTTNENIENSIETEVTTIDSVFVEIDSITPHLYPSYSVADSSWKVGLEINEGFFESYTICYKDSSCFTTLYDESVPVIGGVDYPPAQFINDTTYHIPNIGSSKNGYFELFIYKNGKCKYNEIILKKSISSVNIEILDEQSYDKETQKPSKIEYKYTNIENSIQFIHSIINYSEPNVGCSGSTSELTFTIPTVNDSFYISGTEVLDIKCSYQFSGGLYDEKGSSITKGVIKGKKQQDNNWHIEAEIYILTNSFPQEETFEKEFKLNNYFTTW
ncbi:MAG: hypothetical protein KDD29_05225 [Flavobacteriales bacterium]|nr:hypothetical protein [Flavobacteriales bacterium]MCB9334856.1 hypothetical protein [Flavobacteriales bacterium]